VRRICVLLALILSGCAAQTNIVPSGRGSTNINAAVGGPVVKAGPWIPIPYAAIGVTHGWTDRLDVAANLHLLPLAYGVVGFDAGAAWFPIHSEGARPTIGIQPRLLVLTSLRSDVETRVRSYPILTLTAAQFALLPGLYTGADITVPFTRRNYDRDAEHAILSPFIGYRTSIGKRTRLFSEMKWHGANVRTDRAAVEYIHPARRGALALLIAVQRDF
jgi:hypothetical protein